MSTLEEKRRGRKIPWALLGALHLGAIALAFYLSGVIQVNVGGKMGDARAARARADIENISSAIDMFQIDVGRNPDELEDLLTPPTDTLRWDGPYLADEAVPVDPWGHPYLYFLSGDGSEYVILSYGADGVEGGEGEDADIIEESGR